jgi:hypothetical protein
LKLKCTIENLSVMHDRESRHRDVTPSRLPASTINAQSLFEP